MAKKESAFTALCKKLEHFETDPWAARAILRRMKISPSKYKLIDCCVGSGVLARAAKKMGYKVFASDIHDWGYKGTVIVDFLTTDKKTIRKLRKVVKDNIVFINPPFSKADKFVERAFELGAKGVVCFQRHAWMESGKRKNFWKQFKPWMIYVCGHRATCWRHDIKKSKRKSSSSTAHSWFIFSRKRPDKTDVKILYKPTGKKTDAKAKARKKRK